MTERADVIVVGMGPGGEDAAERLAEAGLDVVGIDGGAGRGRVPLLGMRALQDDDPGRRPAGRGAAGARHGRAAPRSHRTGRRWPRRIREEATDSWDDTVAVRRFEDKGGRFVRGWGRLEGPAGWRSATGRRGRPGRWSSTPGPAPGSPRCPGWPARPYWTNREAIETEEVPSSLAVLGGGAIGVELAQVFRRFGSRSPCSKADPVWSAPRSPKPAQLLAEVFASEGIDVRTGVTVESVAPRRPAVHGGRWRRRAAGGRPAAGGHRAPGRSGPAQCGVHRCSTSRPGPSPSTTTCGSRGWSGSGRSAT